MRIRLQATLCALCLLAGCKAFTGDFPRTSSIVPDTALKVFPDYRISLPDAVMIAGVVYLAYQVVDPLAPAWSIREVRLAENRVQFSLDMQRIHQGGSGEARQVLARRAKRLARDEGFVGYELITYEESIDSRLFLPQRKVEAEVILLGAR